MRHPWPFLPVVPAKLKQNISCLFGMDVCLKDRLIRIKTGHTADVLVHG